MGLTFHPSMPEPAAPLDVPSPKPAWLSDNPRASLVFNAASGSVTASDLATLVTRLREHGMDHVTVFTADNLAELFSAGDSDVIVVLGGDGTARSVAAAAPRDAPPLILLPGGTLNILPKALYGDQPWPDALDAALTRGEIGRLQAGLANDQVFFIAAIFGAPTLFARAREAVRAGALAEAWRRFRHFMKRSFSRNIFGRPDDQPLRRAEAIGILCPAFSGTLDGDGLEWVHIEPGSLIDMARIGMRSIGGPGWRDDSHVTTAPCTRGDIRGHGVMHATLDGEPHTFLARVHIAEAPQGPRVVYVRPEPVPVS